MKQYIGVKLVKAEEMRREKACELKLLRENSCNDGEQEGYKVEYDNGYISWSPKSVFDEAYRSVDGFSFGMAIELLKKGHKVARKGWNGKGMFVFLVPGSHFKVSRAPLLGIYPEGTEIDYSPHIDMKTAQGDIVPWLASQSDVLAEDWNIVE